MAFILFFKRNLCKSGQMEFRWVLRLPERPKPIERATAERRYFQRQLGRQQHAQQAMRHQSAFRAALCRFCANGNPLCVGAGNVCFLNCGYVAGQSVSAGMMFWALGFIVWKQTPLCQTLDVAMGDGNGKQIITLRSECRAQRGCVAEILFGQPVSGTDRLNVGVFAYWRSVVGFVFFAFGHPFQADKFLAFIQVD